MEIRQQYLQNYLHNIALDQLIADYQAKGYLVAKEEKIGNYRADLVARKGDEVVIVEVKTSKMTPKKREQIAGLSDYVRTHGNYKFLVVVAVPPKRKKITIPNIEQLLFDYLVQNFPQSLTILSARTRITDVAGVIVDEITITEDGNIAAKGNGTVQVNLQYGSLNDEAISSDSFPFTFEVILKYNQNQELFISDAVGIEVDNSSFYE